MSIEEKRDQLMEELMPFEDHLERFTYIIDRAKSTDPLPEDCKIETFPHQRMCVPALGIPSVQRGPLPVPG